MKIRSFLSNPSNRIRILLIGIGFVLLVLTINQLLFQRWGFATVQGTLGLGLLLAGVLLSDATLLHQAMKDFLRIALWNVVFIAGVVAVMLFVDRALSEFIGLSMPYIAALWLLVVGARFAHKRGVIITITIIASLLLLLQCAIFGVGIGLSLYHIEHRTLFQLLLVAVLATGVAFVWWFLNAKLSQAKTPD